MKNSAPFPLAALLALLLFAACDEDLSLTNPPPKIGGQNMLYVMPGGTGTGAKDSPLGSIQSALDSLVIDSTLEGILLAAGEYSERLTIRIPAILRGGLDPASNWREQDSVRSIIRGGHEDGDALGITIDGVSGAVDLRDLTIEAPDADQPGAGSYALICRDSDSVRLVRCLVISGNAQPGEPGTDGSEGAPGDDGSSPEPGQRHASGGRGGDEDNARGQTGFCADGSPTGGTEEKDGPGGADGANGPGAVATLRWTVAGSKVRISVPDGSNGISGASGCGGGGGRRGLRFNNSGSFITSPGGGGGGGGQGGGRGSGGAAGGCSAGILLSNSSCELTAVSIVTGNGGRGGAGGNGSPGGAGGKGGPGRSGIIPARPGGDGGSGGHGGHGGGGAGGWSIGVAVYDQSALSGSTPTVAVGNPGPGGAGEGFTGANGKAESIVIIPN